jgi:site-specific DNA-methyltransferase (adenine-specific)
MYSSDTPEWETPQAVFDALDAEFGFELDPCATPENAKCARYYTREQDGLAQDWAPARVFMNPPYGREIGQWVHKAFTEAVGGGNGGLPAACPDRYCMVA